MQYALTEEVGSDLAAGSLQPVHERGANSGGDELAERPALAVDARLAEREDPCMMIVSPSMPTTSERLVTLRGPP